MYRKRGVIQATDIGTVSPNTREKERQIEWTDRFSTVEVHPLEKSSKSGILSKPIQLGIDFGTA
jgi:hypothetical protein